MFEKLHVDRASGELRDRTTLDPDEWQRFEDQNREMLNRNAASVHSQLNTQPRGKMKRRGERERDR